MSLGRSTLCVGKGAQSGDTAKHRRAENTTPIAVEACGSTRAQEWGGGRKKGGGEKRKEGNRKKERKKEGSKGLHNSAKSVVRAASARQSWLHTLASVWGRAHRYAAVVHCQDNYEQWPVAVVRVRVGIL